jgi:hypothetical protein
MGVYLPDGSSGSISKGIIWGGVGVYLAVIIAFYALRSIAIFVMAKRRNIKNAWMAFLPCIWFYTACKRRKTCKKSEIFSQKTVDEWELRWYNLNYL